MLSGRHALLAELVVQALRRDSPDWRILPEVSFSIWGERGVIDLLAWHAGRRALLVIELKTELVDVGEMLGTMHRKQRLAPTIAVERGWKPATVSGWIIVAAGRTNERRCAEFRATLRSAYPDDGRRVHSWLRDPVGSVAALSIWHAGSRPASHGRGTSLAATRRVRPTAGRSVRSEPVAASSLFATRSSSAAAHAAPVARDALATPPKRNEPGR
jgi:hypothetical protein